MVEKKEKEKEKEKKRKKKKKKRNCRWPKQPLRAVWCKTRLLNSGGQFDQLCNLIGGAILAQSTMLAHSPAIIAYGDGRPRSKVCVCACVCVRARVCACACMHACMRAQVLY